MQEQQLKSTTSPAGGASEKRNRVNPNRAKSPAVLMGLLAALVLMALIYVGSRGLKDFDSALIGYVVATVVTTAALIYRYMLWVSDLPPGVISKAAG